MRIVDPSPRTLQQLGIGPEHADAKKWADDMLSEALRLDPFRGIKEDDARAVISYLQREKRRKNAEDIAAKGLGRISVGGDVKGLLAEMVRRHLLSKVAKKDEWGTGYGLPEWE
jgi:hypothetical protein